MRDIQFNDRNWTKAVMVLAAIEKKYFPEIIYLFRTWRQRPFIPRHQQKNATKIILTSNTEWKLKSRFWKQGNHIHTKLIVNFGPFQKLPLSRASVKKSKQSLKPAKRRAVWRHFQRQNGPERKGGMDEIQKRWSPAYNAASEPGG